MIVQPDRPVILASASPRRRELLDQLGLTFSVIPAHINESMKPGEKALDHILRLALDKGRIISDKHPDKIIISADTIVLYKEHILGKPKDPEDAYRMLKMLSGKTHEVVTAFAILADDLKIEYADMEKTSVRFRELSDPEIHDYISGGSPMDKAGAYGIQDLNANLVEAVNGCFYNVIGFPVAKFKKVWDILFLHGK